MFQLNRNSLECIPDRTIRLGATGAAPEDEVLCTRFQRRLRDVVVVVIIIIVEHEDHWNRNGALAVNQLVQSVQAEVTDTSTHQDTIELTRIRDREALPDITRLQEPSAGIEMPLPALTVTPEPVDDENGRFARHDGLSRKSRKMWPFPYAYGHWRREHKPLWHPSTQGVCRFAQSSNSFIFITPASYRNAGD